MESNLFSAQKHEAKLIKLGDALQALLRHVDFATMAAAVDQAAPRASRERGKRPPFSTEVMVRILLIQQLFNLSAEQMEFQLLGRRIFQRFAGLRDSSQIQDRTTIWTFKERLIKPDASESVFEAVNRQLAKHGYIVRWPDVDASIARVPKQTLSKEEKTSPTKTPCRPTGLRPNTPERPRRPLDEAAWQTQFGYKLSANADKRYKLIRKIKISTASENDTLHFEDVLDPANTSRDIYADKGCVDDERETRLRNQGWLITFKVRPSRTNHSLQHTSVVTGALPKPAHGWSTCLPACETRPVIRAAL